MKVQLFLHILYSDLFADVINSLPLVTFPDDLVGAPGVGVLVVAGVEDLPTLSAVEIFVQLNSTSGSFLSQTC